MGSDVLIRIRKCVVTSTKVCCRSVYRHPFLVGFLCWLYCFYRSFPVLFSLVVSASPVLITTAVLLGTLLSYGESNLPELKEEVEVSRRTRSGTAGVVVVERDGGSDVGKSRKARDLMDEDSDDEKESEHERVEGQKEEDSEDEFGDDEDDYNKPLIKGTSRKGAFEKWKCEEVGREGMGPLEVKDEMEVSRKLGEGNESWSGRAGEGEGASRGGMANVEYERLEAEDSHLLSRAVDDPYALNTVYTSFRLSPKREEANDHQGSDSQNEDEHASEIGSDEDGDEGEEEEEEEEEEDDDDENSSNSESDADESSSPDASMTDIIPLLDELHPLLDEDAPQQAHGGVNSTAQRSVDASSIESGEDSENQDGEDDNEEDAHGNKGEGEKPEITWTEDDQKNLMDMGTSELERNQRLENLIARRRARKMMRLADEKNLIDLDSNDLPFSVPHISTLRRNPFDSPIDSYDAMGLPPIPGSAPSILQPRRNPFDLPYDQNEEKPILTGDNFAQEFIPPQRDGFFRRYESFSVGPLNGGTSRQDMRRRPYFVPERTAAEEAYASIQRQLSEVSESKASSVLETESVSSASDDEDQKLTELDTLTETNMVSKDERDSDHAGYESQSTEGAESVDEHANIDVNQNELEIQLGVPGNLQETETLMASFEESSSHMESGHNEINMRVHAVDDEISDGSSHSSPTVELQAEHDEISIEMGYIPEDFGQAEAVRSEIHLPTEQIEDGSDSSSVTSLSDANEEVSDTVGRKESIDETGDVIDDESHSHSPSLVHSPVGESSVSLVVEIPYDHHIKEPVYDSSPTPVERGLLFSSSSTERLPESSEIGDSSHLSVGSEGKKLSYEDVNSQHEHIQLHNAEILTDIGQTSISEAASDQPHLKVEQVSEIDGGSSFSDTDSLEENLVVNNDNDVLQVEQDEVLQSSIQDDRESVAVQDSNVGPDASSDSDSSENQMDTRTMQVDQDGLPAPSSDDDDGFNQERVSAETSNQLLESEDESIGADQKQVHAAPAAKSSLDHNQEIMESSTVEAESIKNTGCDDTSFRTIPEVSVAIPLKNRLIESIKEMSAGGVPSDKLDEFQTPVSARYFDFTSEEFQPNATNIDEAEDETEDFKELDEGTLAELDTVGDFRVPNTEASSVEDTGMAFHHTDDEVPVEEVILPSLLFGCHAVASPVNEDSKDFPMSEPGSPFSDLKEVSSDIEDLIPSNTDALEKTKLEPSSTGSSPNTEILAEGFHDQEHDHIESPKQSLEETPVKSPCEKEKAELEPTSSGSSPDTELLTEGFHAQEHDHMESPKQSLEETPLESPGTKEKIVLEPISSSSSPKSELTTEGLHTREQKHAESPKHTPEETPVESPNKKGKSHDSGSSSSSSDSDSD